jgi:tetratricopeptide (TPR) repeat protein
MVCVLFIRLLVLIGCLVEPLMTAGAEPVKVSPSLEAILDEALQIAGSPATPNNAETLAAIAIRQAKMGANDKAHGLFRQAFNAVWAWEPNDRRKAETKVSLLETIAEGERTAGRLEEMNHTVKKIVAFLQEQNQANLKQDADKANAASYYHLDLDLRLGVLYRRIGDYDSLTSLLKRIVPEIQTAKWDPGLEFQSAADLLARVGQDDEAMKILQSYEKFYDEKSEISKDSYYMHWMYRVTNLAVVANAQAGAGHLDAAESTLKRALEKARSLPVARLNEVLGRGNSLQSAAIKSVAATAAKMGETTIAVEAQKAITDEAYKGSVSLVIKALAKAGDVASAWQLMKQYECCRIAIALGLAERQDWTGAIREDETRDSYREESEYEGHLFPTKAPYYLMLAKARTYVRGSSDALVWARSHSGQDRVYALLGIVDALTEKVGSAEK